MDGSGGGVMSATHSPPPGLQGVGLAHVIVISRPGLWAPQACQKPLLLIREILSHVTALKS